MATMTAYRRAVMPGLLDETEAILRYMAERFGPDPCVNGMAQCSPDSPAGLVGGEGRDWYDDVDGSPGRDGYELAGWLGLRRLDRRSLAAGLLLAEW